MNLNPGVAQMKILENRWMSFTDWPGLDSEIGPLVLNGFFYTRQGTKVMCAYCRGTVVRWNNREDPVMLHARRFPACPFVLNPPDYVRSKYPIYD
jgi:hypothetical protein